MSQTPNHQNVQRAVQPQHTVVSTSNGESRPPYKEPLWARFLTGGLASCTAEVATIPIDTVKVRMQTSAVGGQYSGVPQTIANILKNEGVSGFYKGIAPAIARQLVYSGMRMALYEPIRDVMSRLAGDGGDGTAGEVSFLFKFLSGGTSGAIGIVFANPADLIKTRMQADAAGTRYRGVADAFRTIVRTEGVACLWTGVVPNIQRAFVINAAELATYDHATASLVRNSPRWPNGGAPVFERGRVPTILASSCIAGLVCTVASCPVDVVKNRLMNQMRLPDGSGAQYRGMVHCFVKTVQVEGFLALYRGLLPYWARCGPWSTVMFITYEQYRSVARSVIHPDEP